MEIKPLGRKIRKARKDLGITGEKLSELCHIDATYLRQIEAGAKTPSLPLFITLCRELKVSPYFLLSELLPDPEIQEIELLWELWRKASPGQIKMASAMLRSALEYISEDSGENDCR